MHFQRKPYIVASNVKIFYSFKFVRRVLSYPLCSVLKYWIKTILMHKLTVAAMAIWLLSGVTFRASAQDKLEGILQNELGKVYDGLKQQTQPPYFIDFRVNQMKMWMLQFSSGSLTGDQNVATRVLTVGMRVGSYQRDNSHSTGDDGENSFRQGYSFPQLLPIEDDSLAISQSVWLTSDLAFKQARQSFKGMETKPTDDKEGSKIADFSQAKPVQYFEPDTMPAPSAAELDRWKDELRTLSAFVAKDTNVVNSEAILLIMNERIYYLNTEGARVVQNRPRLQLQLMATVRTVGGNLAPLFKSYYATSLNEFPSNEVLMKDAADLANLLSQLRTAPQAEPYAGPVMLSPEAAGVFFHEIFGHRVEGQRLNNENDGQTFKDKIGKKVLFPGLSVVFDPTASTLDGVKLFGNYKYDDQGVLGQPVTVVDKGVLKNFLMSRTPTEGIAQSNGHGRAQMGRAPFSRQSNLFVKFSSGDSDAELRKLLIKECRKQGKAYGYYFKEVYGGFTTTMRFSPNVFNILPTVVYRIYADGRPDELVRGVTLIGTPLAVFSEIVANGDRSGVFNGFCTAESGSIPVATISPALVIKKIETQKMPEESVVLPQLSSPIVKP